MQQIDKSQAHRIFVFGSNLQGIHGAGAALHAKNYYGAQQGVGAGLQGQSYAIPTKASPSKTLSLARIEMEVDSFLLFTMTNPSFQFNVTQIGCGLAGYKPHEIAPFFNIPSGARQNLWFDKAWEEYLLPGPTNFWNA